MNSQASETHKFAAARALEAQVWQFADQNDVKQAVAACQRLNREYPDFASGWHTTSQIALNTNNPLAALKAVEAALAIEPDNTAWLLQEALCCGKIGRLDRLSVQVPLLLSKKLGNAYQCSALALLLTQLGMREQALKLYQRAAEFTPNEAKHHYNIACLQRTLGELEAAEASFDEAISLNAADYESYKIRSELRRQTADNNHVDELEQLLKSGIDDQRGRVQIHYALAKELEDLSDADRSFMYLKAGSLLRRKLMQYDVQRDLDTMTLLRQTFNTESFVGSATGSDNGEAIFVLGLPRTGTTLVERILASHSDVDSAGELNNLSIEMIRQVRGRHRDPNLGREQLVRLSASLDFAALGDAYVESTRPLTGHTARFVDKMPLNYLYIGLIRLALPNARVVLLQRDPMDTCYAIYKQLFIDAYPFSYSLEELGRYFVAYQQLIDHWKAIMPGFIHTVNYESLVEDTEEQVRELLNFCGLDWQAQCLKFYENKSAALTASTAQVRQPVYKSSIGKWRNYQQQLQPLRDLLADAGIAVAD